MEFIKSILRLLQLLWVLLATALLGNVVATNGGRVGTPALHFTMFVCAISWLTVLYGLVAHFVAAIAVPIALLALDALATLFTFIAAVVLSAKLTAVNCKNLDGKDPSYIAFGSSNDEKRCREIQGGIVFLWFLFATFGASLFFVFKDFRLGGGSIRRGPNMSQIGV
ncbi:hypothetical protein SLS62_001947 [Diatrype stigma]|uniref:MARVEL domain-containing protein n=1 Tax=Diatrype stigma TaxID=117547 RepID=A0AAN9YVK3_9PEZI